MAYRQQSPVSDKDKVHCLGNERTGQKNSGEPKRGVGDWDTATLDATLEVVHVSSVSWWFSYPDSL